MRMGASYNGIPLEPPPEDRSELPDAAGFIAVSAYFGLSPQEMSAMPFWLYLIARRAAREDWLETRQG